MLSIRRCNVVCRATHDKRTVFQAYPPRNPVSLADVSDLLEATTTMPEHMRKEMFLASGADYERVREHLDTVLFLNRIYHTSKRSEDAVQHLENFKRFVTVVALILVGRF